MDGVHRLREDEWALLKALRGANPDAEYVFESSRGGKMCRSNVNRLMKAAGERAGVPICNPHALRHACGYALALRRTDTRRLQKYLGLKSLEVAAVYTDLAANALDDIWMN